MTRPDVGRSARCAYGGRLIVVHGASELDRFFATLGLGGLLEFAGEPPKMFSMDHDG